LLLIYLALAPASVCTVSMMAMARRGCCRKSSDNRPRRRLGDVLIQQPNGKPDNDVAPITDAEEKPLLILAFARHLASLRKA
jgi:hypothetical protein